MIKRLLNPSLIFVVFQAGVGFLHYIYQIFAGKFLPLEEFGLWSVWLAQFAITLLFATWAQSLATLDGPKQTLFRKLFRPGLAWSLLAASLVVAGIAQSQGSWAAMAALGWFWSCWQGIIFGRCLARGSLILISVVMLLAALLKLLVPAVAILLSAEASVINDAFYAGILWGPLAGLVLALFWDYEKSPATGESKTQGFRAKVVATSLLLALVTAAAPQFDLLVAGHILTKDDLGRFGRVALVYKAFFFLILIFAQLLLSKQMQAGGGKSEPHKFLPVVFVGMVISALCWFFFPDSLAPKLWVALGILHISTLTFSFLVVQTEVSQGLWKLGALVVGLWLSQFGVAWFWGQSMEFFYSVALVTDTLLILGILLQARGADRGKAEAQLPAAS